MISKCFLLGSNRCERYVEAGSLSFYLHISQHIDSRISVFTRVEAVGSGPP